MNLGLGIVGESSRWPPGERDGLARLMGPDTMRISSVFDTQREHGDRVGERGGGKGLRALEVFVEGIIARIRDAADVGWERIGEPLIGCHARVYYENSSTFPNASSEALPILARSFSLSWFA